MSEINEMFMDIDPKAEILIEMFVPVKKAEELINIGEKFIQDGQSVHEEQCESNDDCRGDNEFIINELKSYLIIHPELSQMEVLALVSSVVYGLGYRRCEKDELNGKRIPKMPKGSKTIEMNAEDLPKGMLESIKAFMDKKDE